MTVKWKNEFEPDVILNKLSSIRTLLDGGNVSFNIFEYHEYLSVLKSMIDIDENISMEISHKIIEKGFLEAARKTKLTQQNVIREVQKKIREYLNGPDKEYWLVTTLNIHTNNNLPRYRINGCSFCFYKKLPNKFKESRQEFLARASSWLGITDDAFGYYLVVHVAEKSNHDAVNKILNTIDLLRGIWNLYINKDIILSPGRREPVNQVTLGTVHTLHDKNGKKIDDIYWYEPKYCEGRTKADFSENLDKMFKFTKKIRNDLNNHNYKKDVEIAIVRYVRTLDSQDYDSIIIKLWGVLEYLTHTLKDSYKTTIKRTSFQFKDSEYNRQVLEHLKQYRNKSVHLGVEENKIDIHVYQIKEYVEQLLEFHITNNFKFERLEDAAKFMDLQHDIDVLKKQITFCQNGIKFRSDA